MSKSCDKCTAFCIQVILLQNFPGNDIECRKLAIKILKIVVCQCQRFTILNGLHVFQGRYSYIECRYRAYYFIFGCDPCGNIFFSFFNKSTNGSTLYKINMFTDLACL